MRNLSITMLILLAAACGGQKTPVEPSGVAVVSGHVVDFEAGVGISGVTVAFGETTAVTGAGGSYTLALPIGGLYEPLVDGAPAGTSRVTATYRGDFLVRPGTCISRYGTLSDRRTLRPVSGATVSLGGQKVMSGPDGWYRVDLGCPSDGLIGFNTTFISASHPDYMDQSQVVGRGVSGVSRVDLELQKR
jgi:hypothetical protein